MTTPEWYRGETTDYILTVTTDGAGDNLDTVQEIELQLKASTGEDDTAAPPLLTLTMTGGAIVRRTQTGANVGVADIRIPYNAFTTGGGIPAGTYYFDVVVQWPSSIRREVVKPTKVKIRNPVNLP